jgi:hypothetical protein
MALEKWEIDSSHSGIHFSVRHMVVAKVRGQFATLDGVRMGATIKARLIVNDGLPLDAGSESDAAVGAGGSACAPDAGVSDADADASGSGGLSGSGGTAGMSGSGGAAGSADSGADAADTGGAGTLGSSGETGTAGSTGGVAGASGASGSGAPTLGSGGSAAPSPGTGSDDQSCGCRTAKRPRGDSVLLLMAGALALVRRRRDVARNE